MVIATNQPVRRQIRMNIPGVLKTLLAGYSGGITIIRELTQNADDAPGDEDRWIEFHFMPDRLIVRNSTYFRDEDFDNIEEIARGGKQLETRSLIGAFGVGFTSVYQLTDTPIVRSSGREIKFLLETQDLEEQPSTVIDFTEFELPYRREVTPVSIALGMPPVTEDWVEHILNELPDETQRLLLFLRRVDRIAIFDRQRLVAEVSRKTSPSKSPGGPGHLHMTLRSATGAKRTQSWLRFTGKTEREPMRTPDGRPEKDQTVQVAVPDTDITDQEIAGVFAGRLYNYLPTEIRTGLPFQINGDFYPSTDRKSIDNDRYHHQLWHSAVLEAIGDCFVQAIPYLLERFREHPEQFYRRLPITASTALAEPIVEACQRAARDLPLFATRQGWRTAAEVFRVELGLRPLLEGVDLPIMELEREQILAPLLERLEVRTFGLPGLIERWQHDIRAGALLSQGPVYLQTPDQLNQIYSHLEERFARSFGDKIAQAPIFLDHQQRLRPADQCRRAPSSEVCETFAESGLHFWAGNDSYAYLLQQIPSLTLSDVWNALRLQLPHELLLREAPTWLNTNQKLYRVYRAILDIKGVSERVQREQVSGIPICLSRDEWLRQPVNIAMPGNDPVVYDILADIPDLQLVAKSTHENLRYRQLYLDLGVHQLSLEAIVDRLGRLSRAETLLEKAHPCLNTREKLLRIYRYLRDHRQELERPEIEALRHRMAIWLCQDRWLRFAHGSDGREVMTPPTTTDWPKGIKVGRVLDVENRDALGTLFEVIGIKPLDTVSLIDHYLLPQFAQLTWNEQKSALKYLEMHMDLLMRDAKLLERVRCTPLIIANDEQLSRADALCYPSDEVAQVFGSSVRTPQIVRYFGRDVPSDPMKWPWYRLAVHILGMGTCPPSETVLTRINALMREPVESSRQSIEKLFRYLERHWDTAYQRAGLGRHLREMAWLPADGTNERLYRASELFPSQEKVLIGHVAPVLGFREARRPQKSIADALGFPSVFERNANLEMPHAPKVVEELLKLSELGEPAHGQIYKYLNDHLPAGPSGLPKLKGKCVIWAGKRYWKAEDIFFQDYRKQFGSYRGYAVNPDYPDLLHRLGAHEQPNHTDYRNIVREISEKIGDAAVPDEEQTILLNAYDCLGDAEDFLLDPLKTIASVLSCSAVQARNGLGEMRLRRPGQAVLTPADRYIEALPNLPVARCNPDGVALLSRIGVRLLDSLIHYQMAQTGDLRQPASISSSFAGLGRPLQRLLYHFLDSRSVQQREQALWNTIKALQAYKLPILTVTYEVELGGTTFTSDARDENMFFDMHRQEVYIRSGLKDREQASELALILHQLLAIPGLQPAMLRDILIDPTRADQEMDYNQIRQLPHYVEVGPIADDLELFWTIGAQTDEEQSPAELEEVFTEQQASHVPWKPVTAGQTVIDHHQANGIAEEPSQHQPKPREQTEPRENKAPNPKLTDKTTNGRNDHKPALKSQTTKAADTDVPEKPIPHHPSVATGSRPAFVGRTEMNSPTIATDVEGLIERTQEWEKRHPQLVAAPSMPEKAYQNPSRAGINPVEPREQTIVRFVLTFPEATQGFLRLNARAQQLFPHRPDRVYCHTSEGPSFTLWLNWNRSHPIAYADEMRVYFASQEIPGGGIVYIEQLHQGEYRLFYNHQPHEVREVRIALNEQGQLTYEHIDAVSVNCETVDAIYRAEKRHEDQIALYMDAAGKKSILETLCDLFMASERTWIHQDDLKAMVMAERMVADSSVQQTLQNKACFIPDGQGLWRFAPDKVAASLQQDPFITWQRATHRLMRTDAVSARRFNNEVTALIGELSAWLHNVASLQASQAVAGVAELVKRILEMPQDDKPAGELRRLVIEQIRLDESLEDDGWLRAVLEAATTAGVAHVLRPVLREALELLRRTGRMDDVPKLITLWNGYDAGHRYDLGKILAEVETWRMLKRADVTSVELVTTIRQHPEIIGLQPRLKMAIFRDLQRLDPRVWLMNGVGVAAVETGIVAYKPLLDARRYLNQADQREFDRAVRDCCLQIWDDLDDEGRVALVLSTWNNLPLAEVRDNQVAFLRREAERRREREPVMALLIGRVVWQAISSNDRLHRPYIAAHLAACYRRLEIWELAQGEDWLKELNRREVDDLSGLGTYHAATHTRRMTAFCELLQQNEAHPLMTHLRVELDHYRKLVE